VLYYHHAAVNFNLLGSLAAMFTRTSNSCYRDLSLSSCTWNTK